MLNRLPHLFRQQENGGCEALSPLLSLYADGMASTVESRRIEAHLEACPECRLALRWMQATHQAISSRPVAQPPDDLRARIARAIAETEAASAAPRLKSAPPRRHFVLRPALGYGLSVALFALVSGTAFWHADHPAAPTVHPVAVTLPEHVASRPIASLPSSLVPKHHSLESRPAAASPAPSALVAEEPMRHRSLPAAPPAAPAAPPADLAANPPAESTVVFQFKKASHPVAVHPILPAPPMPSLVANRKAAHHLIPLPGASVHTSSPSAPQQIAALPHPNPMIANPPAPPLAQIGSPTITPDQTAVVAAALPSVNHTLQRIALGIDTDKTITVHDIALTKHNVEARFADDNSDSSGTVAITAGPVR